jgi:multisubunit Na+/H+ antiporter MnhB subunit
MDGLLEFLVLFFLLFRWFMLVFGIGFIAFLLRLRKRRKGENINWLIKLGIVLATLIIAYSLYFISVMDFGLFRYASWH